MFWLGDPLWSNGQHRRLGIRRLEVRISLSPKYFSWFITIILRHGLSLSFFPDVDKGEAEWRTKGEVEWKKDWKQQDSTQLQVAPSNINCNIYRYDWNWEIQILDGQKRSSPLGLLTLKKKKKIQYLNCS